MDGGVYVGDSSSPQDDSRILSLSAQEYSTPIDYEDAPYTIEQVPFDGDRGTTFSPDGSKLVFADRNDNFRIKIFDIETGLISGPLTPPDIGSGAESITWTNDGKIFFQTEPVDDQTDTLPYPLWVMNEDGSDLQQVEFPPGLPADFSGFYNVHGAIKISPDGLVAAPMSRIEFEPRLEGAAYLRFEIWIMDVLYENGVVRLDNPRAIISDENVNEVKDFTSDGKKVVFCSTRDTEKGFNLEIYTYDLATGEIRRHTHADFWEEQGDLIYGDGSVGDAIAFQSDRAHPDFYQIYYNFSLPWDGAYVVPIGRLAMPGGTTHELFVAGPQGCKGPQ